MSAKELDDYQPITATHAIIQDVTLDLKRLDESHQYDFAIISPAGETVGWLKESHSGLYRKIMIDNSFFVPDIFIVPKDCDD